MRDIRTFLPNLRAEKFTRPVFCVAALLAFIHLACHFWITRDFSITYRVIVHALGGEGLRWNVDERVQVYTHPLWMLCLLMLDAVTGHIIWCVLGLSLGCAVGAVYFLIRTSRLSWMQATLFALVPLSVSNTFQDFAVCGLENVLSIFLISWFIYELMRPAEKMHPERLVLAAGLGLVTRMDNILIVLPGLLAGLYQYRHQLKIMRLLQAILPCVAWFGFSLLYYGFLYPNTRYAKISGHIAMSEYIGQGAYYVKTLAFFDPIGSFLSITAIILTAMVAVRRMFSLRERIFIVALALGMLLNVAYVISIGGDYIAGRFLSNVVWVGITLNCLILPACSRRIVLHVACIFILLLGLHHLHVKKNIFYPRIDYGNAVSNFRKKWGWGWSFDSDDAWMEKFDLPQRDRGKPAIHVVAIVAELNIPNHDILIDPFALCDPLLAHLPPSFGRAWHPGHLWRDIPQGYVHARQTGKLNQMNPHLANYYQKLRSVTSDPLFNSDRLNAILGFQLGWWDHWLDEYNADVANERQAKARRRIE